MKKSDLQALYKQIKSRKKTSHSASLFASRQLRTGCKSCGKVTWRPNKNN